MPKSLRFVKLPRSKIKLFSRLPFALTMLHTINKTTMIYIFICPNKNAIWILRLVINKPADVHISVDVLQSISIFAIILKRALIKSDIVGLVNKQSTSVIKVVTSLPEIDGSGIFIKVNFAILFDLTFCQFF